MNYKKNYKLTHYYDRDRGFVLPTGLSDTDLHHIKYSREFSEDIAKQYGIETYDVINIRNNLKL